MEEAIQKLRGITGKKNIILTTCGNNAIWKSLKYAKKQNKDTVLIQDQGGWITYKTFPKRLKLNILELKTEYGIINPESTKIPENSIILINSMPGYHALQPMEKLQALAKQSNSILINDIAGSISTDNSKIGDILVGSFGEWKPINLEYGGFIATDLDLDIRSNFDQDRLEQLSKKIGCGCSGIHFP